MMFTLPLGSWFSFAEFNFGNPLLIFGIVCLLAIAIAKLYMDAKKKDEGEDPDDAGAPVPKPHAPSDLRDSLRSLSNIVNFVGVPEGAVILSDLAAGDYSNAPRAARALATKLDTPDGRKELIRRVIQKHAHLFVDDPQIISLYASAVGKQPKR